MHIINEYNLKLTDAIKKIETSGFEKHSFEFNTAMLSEYEGRSTSDNCKVWDSFWESFYQIDKPVVYWFSIKTSQDRKLITAALLEYKSQKSRSVPAIKSNFNNWDTDVLYVGSCSKTRLRDRVHQHFGYYIEGRTQGLQLCHWARSLNLDLELHVLQFPYESADLTALYEKQIAGLFNPLIGKHS